jgi:phosphoribosylamine--glycine ligase
LLRVLVVGGGAREHALAWRLGRDPGVRVWAAPGNDGMRPVAQPCPVRADDADGLAALVAREGIDLVVVGPEAPLVAGVADALRARGATVLGPGADAAAIEGSKGWARAFCARHGIPAPRHRVARDPVEARGVAASWPLPVVCKADGLMAGKGVVVAADRREAVAAAEALARRGPVVFEEFLEGRELSAFALVDGRRFVAYGMARDHKRLRDGDRGPMTGGMGAYAPVPDVGPTEVQAIEDILDRAVAGLRADGRPFVGFLFAGLMLTPAGPRVLEFNCRFGDPEAQALLPLLDGPVAEVWWAAARGALPAGWRPSWRSGAAVGVVLAAPGYPEAPEPGQVISGLAEDGGCPGALAFHAATRREGGAWRTAGGRVLTLVGQGADLAEARARAYAAVAAVTFPGCQWRTDIAAPERGTPA